MISSVQTILNYKYILLSVYVIYNNICVGRTLCVCMYVCSCIQIKKKFSTDLKNSFFPRKVWTLRVTWAILEVSNTTPSCRKPDKPSKNGVFWTSETVLRRFTDSFRRKWTQGVTWALIRSFGHNAELQETR